MATVETASMKIFYAFVPRDTVGAYHTFSGASFISDSLSSVALA